MGAAAVRTRSWHGNVICIFVDSERFALRMGVRRIVLHHHRLGTYLALPGLACFHLGGRTGGRGSEDGKDTIKRSIVR